MSATKKSKLAKTQLSCRISGTVKRLIDIERRLNGGSEGEAVESLIIKGSTSDEAQKFMLAEVQKDPLYSAVMDSLGLKKKQ